MSEREGGVGVTNDDGGERRQVVTRDIVDPFQESDERPMRRSCPADIGSPPVAVLQ